MQWYSIRAGGCGKGHARAPPPAPLPSSAAPFAQPLLIHTPTRPHLLRCHEVVLNRRRRLRRRRARLRRRHGDSTPQPKVAKHSASVLRRQHIVRAQPQRGDAERVQLAQRARNVAGYVQGLKPYGKTRVNTRKD
eukprot:80855-Chlamydomonas_euryale.AAC.3